LGGWLVFVPARCARHRVNHRLGDRRSDVGEFIAPRRSSCCTICWTTSR